MAPIPSMQFISYISTIDTILGTLLVKKKLTRNKNARIRKKRKKKEGGTKKRKDKKGEVEAENKRGESNDNQG